MLISVQDTGIGIPAAKLAQIFLPFEQVGATGARLPGGRGGAAHATATALPALTDTAPGPARPVQLHKSIIPALTATAPAQVDMSISRKYGGFGLGLNIVQDLVRAHDGEVWVESQEGHGSVFTFSLPVYEEGNEGSEAAKLEEASAASSRVGQAAGSVEGQAAGAAGGAGSVGGAAAAAARSGAGEVTVVDEAVWGAYLGSGPIPTSGPLTGSATEPGFALPSSWTGVPGALQSVESGG